jgi:hypothetical protein
MIKSVDLGAWPGCIEISNGDAAVAVSTAFGPRVVSYSMTGGENILGWHPGAEVATALGKWKPYGGHRLWMAPENMPLSYAPDNEPVQYEPSGELSARFSAPVEKAAGIQKDLRVTLSASGTDVEIAHTITNRGEQAIKIAAWALTIMRPGGEVIIPNEPRAPYNAENLLPVRTMALWPYTDLTDPRWRFDNDAIRLSVDENAHSQQKIGVLDRQGWAGYECAGMRFTKRFGYEDGAEYPDMNCNLEVYTDGGFVEVESLSPLRSIAPGEAIEHVEKWTLEKI